MSDLNPPRRPTQHLSDFSAPWCQQILNSPSYRHVPFDSRNDYSRPARNSIWNLALGTPSTIRAIVSLVENVPPPNSAEPPRLPEHLFLVSIGALAVDGPEGALHGGITTALLDELICYVGMTTLEAHVVTANLSVDFRNMVKTPGVYVCRGFETNRDGRKLWARATLEDGEGNVLAECSGLVIVPRGAPKM